MLGRIIEFLPIFGIALGFGYLVITFLLTQHWKKLKSHSIPDDFLPKTPISVLVPAKNEMANIKDLVNHLLAQKYPKDLLEFIIIDDHSVDATSEFLLSLNLPKSFQVLQANGSPGKKYALTQGIACAKGDLIITTDADCQMDANWLRSIVWLYESKKPQLIASSVQFHQEKHLLERFQSLDFLGLMLITGAGISTKQFYMANGANMAFEKSAFQAVNGYEGNLHIPSGDDMFLISKVAQFYPEGSILFNKSLDATVRTRAESSISDFFRQRLRWGSKNTASDDGILKLVLGWVLLTSLWIVFFWWMKYWWVVLLLKLAGDYYLLNTTSEFYQRKDLMKSFLPSFLMHTIYIAIVGLLSIFHKPKKW